MTKIGAKVVEAILHPRRSFLFNKNNIWIKKKNSNLRLSVGMQVRGNIFDKYTCK